MKKRLKAEMWDKMQYLFRNYYDRTIHAEFFYDSDINADTMRGAIKYMLDSVPILHSSFRAGFFSARWKVEEYDVDDVFTVTESTDPEGDTDRFILGEIPETGSVQCRFALIKNGGRSIFCMIVNHMCCDGGDTKYFLEKLCRAYTALSRKEPLPFVKSGTRSHTAVYSGFIGRDLKRSTHLYKNISEVGESRRFPYGAESADDVKTMIKHKVPAEKFEKLKNIGRIRGFTLNDILTAAYMRSLYDIGVCAPNEQLTVPCMVDLRRYIKDCEDRCGLCNHTGFMLCRVPEKGKTFNDMLAYVHYSNAFSKEDRFMGLYSLPLLRLAYALFPFKIAEFFIKLGYENPLIGMSNIGLLNKDSLSLNGAAPDDGFMSGAVKYKPYIQLALTTLGQTITMTMAVRANAEDRAEIESFLDGVEANLDKCITENGHLLTGSEK